MIKYDRVRKLSIWGRYPRTFDDIWGRIPKDVRKNLTSKQLVDLIDAWQEAYNHAKNVE